METPAVPETAPAPAPSGAPDYDRGHALDPTRDGLGRMVLCGSFTLVFLVVLLALSAALFGPYIAAAIVAKWPDADVNFSDAPISPEVVFTTVTTLAGTWVGTLMAFYFGRANAESASAYTIRAVGQASGDPGRQARAPVSSIMIAAGSIQALRLGTKSPADVPLSDIIAVIRNNRIVTRVPVLQASGAVLCVIHDSLIYQYSYIAAQGGPAARGPTLQDLLADSEAGPLARLFECVAEQTTLADARRRMDGVSGCQDLFVTATGRKDEPMLGWVTNSTLLQSLRV